MPVFCLALARECVVVGVTIHHGLHHIIFRVSVGLGNIYSTSWPSVKRFMLAGCIICILYVFILGAK